MKSIWTVISTLALANLLAIVGFVAWLSATDRLNRERVTAVRTLFAGTVTEAASQKAAEVDAAKKAEAQQLEAARMAKPAASAEEKIQRDRAADEVNHQSKLRLDSELRSLQEFLVRENERLQKWEIELKSRQQTFESQRKAIHEVEGTEQFKKVLATLGGVKAKEAQSMLSELLAQGKQAEVIAYLNSMDERTRSKIVAEFNKIAPPVAAELLEGLRTYGTPLSSETASETPTNAADSK
jgi:flagellar motility protein MotE (MotC chaperone)